MATEASFLAYSHGDVEHDFVRIIELLNREPEPPASRWRKLRWRLRGGARPAWQGRVVVVLDELDKLTATEEGRLVLPKLLAELKNILTTRHVHFVFVGGPDLHDAAILDATRGNSVYESVFACHLYVPCLWNATDVLLDAVIPESAITDSQRSLLRGYLDYKARGVPRLLLRELNELVRFQEEGVHLQVDAAMESRIVFYARLQTALDDFLGRPEDEDMFTLAIDRDRWRLGATTSPTGSSAGGGASSRSPRSCCSRRKRGRVAAQRIRREDSGTHRPPRGARLRASRVGSGPPVR